MMYFKHIINLCMHMHSKYSIFKNKYVKKVNVIYAYDYELLLFYLFLAELQTRHSALDKIYQFSLFIHNIPTTELNKYLSWFDIIESFDFKSIICKTWPYILVALTSLYVRKILHLTFVTFDIGIYQNSVNVKSMYVHFNK